MPGDADAGTPTLAARQDAPGIWAFIAADCVGFAIFFCVFMSERAKQPALFDASSRQLDTMLGLANTLILVTSSWLVALAVTAAEAGRMAAARTRLIAGTSVAALFAVVKIAEYHHKLEAGIDPTTNGFFTFYFILTGVHFLHYAIGIGVLIWMIALTRRGAAPALLEAGGLYWHMVDLLWLFLFPMLYLLGSH